MAEGKNLIKEAVKDAKSMKELALEAAKNELVESMAPALKRLLEKQLHGTNKESVDRVNAQGSDYYSPASREKEKAYQEGTGDSNNMDDMNNNSGGEDEKMESLASFFAPQISEEEGYEESLGMGGIPVLGEEDHDGDDDDAVTPNKKQMAGSFKHGEEDEAMEEAVEDEGMEESTGNVDEELEISEAELRKVYEAALQTEVLVSKGFKEMTKSGEVEELDPGAGINKMKSGQHPWEKEHAPAEEKWAVYREMVQRGLSENKQLRESLKMVYGRYKKLLEIAQKNVKTLHEVNLFNAKVLHVNRIMNTNARLTKEQKRVVMERIDKARSIAEVRMVFETIVESFNAMQPVNESAARKPVANAQRARTSGAPNSKVLGESVDRASSNSAWARMAQLAGITK